MVPFQSDINRSSPLSRPYEQASVYSQRRALPAMRHVYHTGTEALLAFLQLLQQAEVARNLSTHGRCVGVRGMNRCVAREEVGCTPLSDSGRWFL